MPMPPAFPVHVTADGRVFEAHDAGLSCPCLPLLQPHYAARGGEMVLLGTSLYHRSHQPQVRRGRAGDA